MARPVKPQDAASLVLVRTSTQGGPEVLMGRRPARSAFMPSVYVFPGGRVDPSDSDVSPASALKAPVRHHLETRGTLPALALANAAIRETFEETGLLLTAGAPVGAGPEGSWRELLGHGAPDHAALEYLGRAITPASSPRRFHARFFLADADKASGDLAPSEELLDLAFFPIAQALTLPIIDVTELMLKCALEIIERDEGSRPFLRYRGERSLITRETLGA